VLPLLRELACIEQRLSQQGQSTLPFIERGIPPSDQRLAGIRAGCLSVAPPTRTQVIANPQALGSATTFDCTTAKSGSGRILCSEQDGPKLDWDITSAYWATYFSIPETEREGFKRTHDDWVQQVNRFCQLAPQQSTYAPRQRQCVLTAFKMRAGIYRSRLGGDALIESKLTPEQHADLQKALEEKGFLRPDQIGFGTHDGEFGQVTRIAIRQFQQTVGASQSGFLSNQQRSILLDAGATAARPDANQLNAVILPLTQADINEFSIRAATLAPKEAANQCQSEDAEKRLVGCTAIINAKRKGTGVSAWDAFDGRCSAFNELGQFQRGAADCKASVASNPRYSYAYHNLGASMLGLGDAHGAIDALTKAINLKPNFIHSYLDRAKAYLMAGNSEMARKDFEVALTIDMANQIAIDGIDALNGTRSPPIPAQPPVQTAKLKEANQFLNDAQVFMGAQTSVPQIGEIAREAATLRLAIDKLDEVASNRSSRRLRELLESIKGFAEFVNDRQTERQAVVARRLADVSAEAGKGTYFVGEYLRQNLADAQTERLLTLKQRLETAVRNRSSDEIINANSALQEFLKQNTLLERYVSIVRDYQSPTPMRRNIDAGAEDDLVILYNALPSAPSIAKDISGHFIFLACNAFVCFSPSGIDDGRARFVDRLLRNQGAKDITHGQRGCDLAGKRPSIDVVAFMRGALRDQPREYVLTLKTLLDDDSFREYATITGADYQAQLGADVALSSKIAQEVEDSQRSGYGVLTMTDAAMPTCVTTSKYIEGLKDLLQQKQGSMLSWVQSELKFVATPVDDAFMAAMKEQCGMVAGEAKDLRVLVEALRRERKHFEFAPVWFATEEVATTAAQVGQRVEEERRAEENRKRNVEERTKNQRDQRDVVERDLRTKFGVRARALRGSIQAMVRSAAEAPVRSPARRDIEAFFPHYATWLDKRSADRWETTGVTSDIADFGIIQWNGRPLDGVIIKTLVMQKNRIQGADATVCFMFGLVDDVEYSMERDPIGLECENSGGAVAAWKLRREFRSLWNAE